MGLLKLNTHDSCCFFGWWWGQWRKTAIGWIQQYRREIWLWRSTARIVLVDVGRVSAFWSSRKSSAVSASCLLPRLRGSWCWRGRRDINHINIPQNPSTFFLAALFTDGNMLKLHKIGSSRVKHVIPGLVFWNLRRIFHGFSPSCSIICPSCFHIFHYLSIIAPSFSIIVPLFFQHVCPLFVHHYPSICVILFPIRRWLSGSASGWCRQRRTDGLKFIFPIFHVFPAGGGENHGR